MRSDRDHHVSGVENVDSPVMPDLDVTLADDPGGASVGDGAGILEPFEVTPIIGLGGSRSSVDHEVAVR
jgi:hypothetical protein